MRRSFLRQMKRGSAAWLSCLLVGALCIPVAAQVAAQAHAQHPVRFGYDKAHELTLNATIQSVTSHSAPGAPAGLHLLLSSSQGPVDAHLGPYLSKEVRRMLRSGTALQVVGATEQVHGKSYLLARELVIGGRTITVRSTNGFLREGEPVRRSRSTEQSRLQLNGGAQ